MDIQISIAVILGAILIGSIPTSYLIGRFVGRIDIRENGSGNVGASNLTAQVGAKWATPVVMFDVFAKGLLPVFIASDKVLGLGLGIEVSAGIASIIGHNWSIFVGFKGGRGMATVLGTILALNFPLLVLYGSVPALGVLFTPWKDSAVWWMIAVIVMPIWAALLNLPVELVWFSIAFAVATALKRMASNSLRDDQDSISTKLLLTRLVFDRDIADRNKWVSNQ
ncbi:MAG: glycerol-3-phosphate acyltransferase [Chloroflexi bacterium]|nr:glycerol-3-phosphate acyltransferase [Chloroflexota bacterium]